MSNLFIFKNGLNVNKSKSKQLFYSAMYNAINQPNNATALANKNTLTCDCFTEVAASAIDVNKLNNQSRVLRVANILKNSTSFQKIRYANTSPGGIYINHLGRTEGQPGGGGKPPKNRLV